MIRTHSRYVIIGAGIHGLSTAWHLARDLRARGLGGGEDILVLDKRGAGAGVGIACGTVRNGYFSPHARADGAFGVRMGERPRRVLLPSGRLLADCPGGDVRRGESTPSSGPSATRPC
jgi:glycine/D-amino acid oxidase-like deaminating enzyme